MQTADAAADAHDHHHGCGRQSEREAQEKPRRTHAHRETEQVARREVQQPVGDEGDRHDDLHVLNAPQDTHRDVLDAVRQLVERSEDHQVRGDGDHLGVGGEEGRDHVAHRDENQRCEGVPRQHEVVRRLGRERQLADVARAVAVRHADGGGRADRHDDHKGAVADGRGDLVGAHRLLVEPPHHNSRADEGRGFEEHLHRDRQAHVQQLSDRRPRVVARRKAFEIDAVFAAAVKVADHQHRGDDARHQRAQARALGAHLGKSVAAVDEHPVEADVREVGRDRDEHLDLRVAHAFEELFEGEEQHDERRAVNQHLVVGDGHIDHFGGLAEMIEQRDGGILHDGHRQAEQSVEEDAVLQQARRFFAVALGVEFAHEGRHAECDADGGDEEDEEDRAAERHGSQRRGVVSAVTADHEVVGELRQDLAQLREHHGQRQPQVGLVLVFVCCEFVHRCAKVRIISGKREERFVRIFPS